MFSCRYILPSGLVSINLFFLLKPPPAFQIRPPRTLRFITLCFQSAQSERRAERTGSAHTHTRRDTQVFKTTVTSVTVTSLYFVFFCVAVTYNKMIYTLLLSVTGTCWLGLVLWWHLFISLRLMKLYYVMLGLFFSIF